MERRRRELMEELEELNRKISMAQVESLGISGKYLYFFDGLYLRADKVTAKDDQVEITGEGFKFSSGSFLWDKEQYVEVPVEDFWDYCGEMPEEDWKADRTAALKTLKMNLNDK